MTYKPLYNSTTSLLLFKQQPHNRSNRYTCRLFKMAGWSLVTIATTTQSGTVPAKISSVEVATFARVLTETRSPVLGQTTTSTTIT